MLVRGLSFMWIQGLGFGRLYDFLIYRGFARAQWGHFSNSFIPLDLSSDGRVIVGGTGAVSGLPGWVAITRHD